MKARVAEESWREPKADPSPRKRESGSRGRPRDSYGCLEIRGLGYEQPVMIMQVPLNEGETPPKDD